MSISLFKNKTSSVTVFTVLAVLFFITTSAFISRNFSQKHRDLTTDSLPNVFNETQEQVIVSKLRQEAILTFPLFQLPATKKEWEIAKTSLKKEIVKKTGVILQQNLPLNVKETGSVKMEGYTIKNIAFQTRPGVYATASLYVPDGQGKFPGVIVMMGHSSNGRFYDKYQEVGITLASQGYVSLCIDPWGSGERTTSHGIFEDHGDENNLGAAVMDVGETLMGMLLTDNIRGVDLLHSLPYVDPLKIGATGSSGGGNQSMWLAALDERVKAVVPVVSAGTFEAYIMGTPCICEVLVDGLTFTEESAVLSMIAPRALKMSNHSKDANAAFNPKEMIRSYNNARPLYTLLGAENNIAYETFDLPHGYFPEDRRTMLGWFNLHLKGTGDGSPVQEKPIKTLPLDRLLVYPYGQRETGVATTESFCKQKGVHLRAAYLKKQTINAALKRTELREIVKINSNSKIADIKEFAPIQGWKRFAIKTSDNKLLPLLIRLPSIKTKGFAIVSDPLGKHNIAKGMIDSLLATGSGVAIPDLSATGETGSPLLFSTDSVGRLRSYSKSLLWLGKTIMGEWAGELETITNFINLRFKPATISLIGRKETGLAGLFLAAIKGNIQNITLIDAPVSYLFDDPKSVEYYSTAIHIPGFLNWGDVSLAAALTGTKVQFKNTLTMSGRTVSALRVNALAAEFSQMRLATGLSGKTFFE